jgi:hypothetical protein
MPLTVGGAGLREGLGLVILGHFGVSAPEVVAAGLITLAVYLGWAACGGLIVLFESRLRRADTRRE